MGCIYSVLGLEIGKIVNWEMVGLQVTPREANSAMVEPPILRLPWGAEVDSNSPHLVVTGTSSQEKEMAGFCCVLLSGTGISPTVQTSHCFGKTACSEGMNFIALSYQFGPYPDAARNDLCSSRADPQSCLESYHRDIACGGRESGLVDVSPCNSILGRLLSLIQYLTRKREGEEERERELSENEKWSGFLSLDKSMLDLSKFVFVGHSQGAGHVCWLSRNEELAGSVLISGPQELMPLPVDVVDGGVKGSSSSLSWMSSNGGTGKQQAEYNEYKTRGMYAFQHSAEEGTAETSLVERNWSAIEPLSHTEQVQLTFHRDEDEGLAGCVQLNSTGLSNGLATVLSFDKSCKCENHSITAVAYELLQQNKRSFVTSLPPHDSGTRDPRPNHASTAIDAFVPRIPGTGTADLDFVYTDTIFRVILRCILLEAEMKKKPKAKI